MLSGIPLSIGFESLAKQFMNISWYEENEIVEEKLKSEEVT